MASRMKQVVVALSVLALWAVPAFAATLADTSDWYAAATWQGSSFTITPPTTRAMTYPANGRGWMKLGFDYGDGLTPQTGPSFLGVTAKVGVYGQPMSEDTQNWVAPKAHWEVYDRNEHLLAGGDGAGGNMMLEAGLKVTGTGADPGKITFNLAAPADLLGPDSSAFWPAAGRTYTLGATEDGGGTRKPWFTYDARAWVSMWTDSDGHKHYRLYVSIKENGEDIKGDAGRPQDDSPWTKDITTDIVGNVPEGCWMDNGDPRAFTVTGTNDYSGTTTYNVWSTAADGTPATLLATASYPDSDLGWAYTTAFAQDSSSVPATSTQSSETVVSGTPTLWTMRPRLTTEFAEMKHEPQPDSPTGMRDVQFGQTLISPIWKTPWDTTSYTDFSKLTTQDTTETFTDPSGASSVTRSGSTWIATTNATTVNPNYPHNGAAAKYTASATP